MVGGMRPNGSVRQLQARRTKAVALLKQGHSCQAVARIVQSSISSLVRWMQSFRRKGKAGLKPLPTPGRPPQMKRQQKQELIGVLKQGSLAAGYPTGMWTTRRVAEQIQRHWGIAYHPGHVWKILIVLGWSCQNPAVEAARVAAYKKKPGGCALIWFSSMKAASCSFRRGSALGRRGARRRCCGTAIAGGGSRSLED
jgi:transposase